MDFNWGMVVGVVGTVFGWLQPATAFTWQDWLLIAVSITVAGIVGAGVIYALTQVVKLLREVRVFMADLAREVGTNSGKSLAARLHSQDDMLERAHILAERKALTDAAAEQLSAKETEDLRVLVREMAATIVHANENRVMWERYMEFLQKSTSASKDITQTVNQAASAPTHTNTLTAGAGARLGQTGMGDGTGQNIQTGD